MKVQYNIGNTTTYKHIRHVESWKIEDGCLIVLAHEGNYLFSKGSDWVVLPS